MKVIDGTKYAETGVLWKSRNVPTVVIDVETLDKLIMLHDGAILSTENCFFEEFNVVVKSLNHTLTFFVQTLHGNEHYFVTSQHYDKGKKEYYEEWTYEIDAAASDDKIIAVKKHSFSGDELETEEISDKENIHPLHSFVLLAVGNLIEQITEHKSEVVEIQRPTIQRKNKHGKKQNRKPVYLFKKVILADNEQHYTRGPMKCEVWDVRGHYRHYKSGKVVFVAPYKKGKMRDCAENYKRTTYLAAGTV